VVKVVGGFELLLRSLFDFLSLGVSGAESGVTQNEVERSRRHRELAGGEVPFHQFSALGERAFHSLKHGLRALCFAIYVHSEKSLYFLLLTELAFCLPWR
jgi:hypothetical protein